MEIIHRQHCYSLSSSYEKEERKHIRKTYVRKYITDKFLRDKMSNGDYHLIH